MAIELRQNVELALEQRISLQLQQAIKLLRLSRLELQEYLSNELLENPFLEDASLRSDVAASEVKAEDIIREEITSHMNSESENGNFSSEIDWEPLARTKESEDLRGQTKSSNKMESNDLALEQTAIYRTSLVDHILGQFHILGLSLAERKVANEIVGNLDSQGYLAISVKEIAEKMNHSEEFIHDVRTQIQQLDPPGIGSLNLPDCLLSQLDQSGVEDELARKILSDHVDLLEDQKFKELCTVCSVSQESLSQTMDMIRLFDPYPGRRFSSDPLEGVIVDLIIKKVGVSWIVILNEDGLPSLAINEYYQKQALESRNRSSKPYFGQKLRAAKWVVSSVLERQKLLLRVGQEIMQSQVDFLELGVKHMKPLRLKDVAENIGCDPSTVSRLTSQKYAQTPRGTFELKYFFTNALLNDDGKMVTTKSIRARLKEMIEAENPQKPFSDQALMKMLQAEGIQIARRTVAKYRETLGYPSSNQRASRN